MTYNSIKCAFIILILLLVVSTVSTPAHSLPNQAAAYCSALGYKPEISKASDGSEIGYCRLPDNRTVEEWPFFRGEIAQEYSYCSKHGYKLKVKNGIAACVLEDGKEVEVTKLMNLGVNKEKCNDGFCGNTENHESCPADCPCEWTGTWQEEGNLNSPSFMILIEYGNEATGVYIKELYTKGEIEATASRYGLSGTYSENNTTNKIYNGTFEFLLSDDCKNFSGKWTPGGTTNWKRISYSLQAIPASSHPPEKALGFVEGRVYDEKNGVGIASAEMIVDNNPTGIMTDALGNYRLSVIPSMHIIDAHASNYGVKPRSIIVYRNQTTKQDLRAVKGQSG